MDGERQRALQRFECKNSPTIRPMKRYQSRDEPPLAHKAHGFVRDSAAFSSSSKDDGDGDSEGEGAGKGMRIEPSFSLVPTAPFSLSPFSLPPPPSSITHISGMISVYIQQ